MAFSRETRSATKRKLASITSKLEGSSSSSGSSTSASTAPTQAGETPTPALESPTSTTISYRDAHETKGHSTALDLSRFATLPYDLRVMIWEASFVSRQVPIICETLELTAKFNPPFKRISISRETSEYGSPPGPEYSSFLTCPKFISPPALGVNHESRQIALQKYRPWKMFNKKCEVRNIMWCPALDVVSLLQAMTLPYTPDYIPFIPPLPIFSWQFPAEIVEIKNLAVPSTMWRQGQHKNIDVIWPLIDFLSLEELVVVLEKNKEREFAAHPTRGLSTFAGHSVLAGVEPNWTIPEDIDTHVLEMRNHYEKFGPEYMPLRKKPVVTIVDKEEQIHGDQNLHLIIRCAPCKYLDIDDDGTYIRPTYAANGSAGTDTKP